MRTATNHHARTWCASAVLALLVALPWAVAVAQDEGDSAGDDTLALPNDESEAATGGAADYGLEQANEARAQGRGYGEGRAGAAGGNASSGASASGGAGGAGASGGAGGSAGGGASGGGGAGR